jgi:hypothetical protein
MLPHLEQWRHVADANGGFDLSSMAPMEADQLVTALRRTAERELLRVGSVSPNSEADAYRLGLTQLLKSLPAESRGVSAVPR